MLDRHRRVRAAPPAGPQRVHRGGHPVVVDAAALERHPVRGVVPAGPSAQQAAQLTVFQRTPNFSIPAGNGPVAPERRAPLEADRDAYRLAAKIDWQGCFYRNDIGYRAIARERGEA